MFYICIKTLTMQIELVHPNGLNTRKCDPKQAERLRKQGWRDTSNGQPLAEVVKFQQMPKEVADIINTGCACGGECKAEQQNEPEVVDFTEQNVNEYPTPESDVKTQRRRKTTKQ